MKVKTIKDHSNDYGVRDGAPYDKSNGLVYEIDDEAAAQHLIDVGYVEKAGSGKKSA